MSGEQTDILLVAILLPASNKWLELASSGVVANGLGLGALACLHL